MNERPTLFSIFAGIGGFDLAFQSAGFRTLAFVEWEPIKQVVLREWFPGIPIHGDIDTFDCSEFLRTYGRPDVIAGGVPCQAASLLGTRLGTADPRWKWPQTIRLVSELRPRYCVFENPPAILSLESGRAFNGILSQMASLGYDGMWDVIPAAAFGAGHWRERLCIVFADAHMRENRERFDSVGSDGSTGTSEQIGAGDRSSLSADAYNLDRRSRAGRQNGTEVDNYCQRKLSPHAHSERRTEAGRCLPEGESADELRRQSAANSGQAFPADAMRCGRSEGRQGRPAGDNEGQAEQALRLDAADTKRTLPDLRGRVIGPDWWHEAQSGIPVMAARLPAKLVEAASLCIGDSVVPQAWAPIAQAIYAQLAQSATLTPDSINQ